jgi:hypothetical protein
MNFLKFLFTPEDSPTPQSPPEAKPQPHDTRIQVTTLTNGTVSHQAQVFVYDYPVSRWQNLYTGGSTIVGMPSCPKECELEYGGLERAKLLIDKYLGRQTASVTHIKYP